ncbi:MAG: carbohydrate ABC transporter permease [Clostridium sp.]|nr:carbohydrate ABC transporter permease [Clostridium sp.]
MINMVLLTLMMAVILYPLYFIVIASISSPAAVNSGQVLLFPKGATLEGYKYVLKDNSIWKGYANTIILTVTGTLVNMFLTVTCAYALSKSHLPFIKFIMFAMTFTMFFSGGIIPTYLLVSGMGMRDTIWSLILPTAVSVYNVILMRTYFMNSVPDEIIQAAKIDGCSEIKALAAVVLPLSKPILVTIALFYGVGHWNQFFQALIYISDKDRFPLQLVLRNMLLMGNNAMTSMLSGGMSGENAKYMAELMKQIEILKYAVIIVSVLPVLIVYPFLQKFFMKGIMMGSLKG